MNAPKTPVNVTRSFLNEVFSCRKINAIKTVKNSRVFTKPVAIGTGQPKAIEDRAESNSFPSLSLLWLLPRLLCNLFYYQPHTTAFKPVFHADK
jgi:hypothetical protein